MTPNIGIMKKKTLQFEPFIMKNNKLNTFRANHDGISSKYMAKQCGG